MSTESVTEVTVELADATLRPAGLVGLLRRAGSGDRAVVSFAYDSRWLDDPNAFALDPTHGLYPGPQYGPDGRLAGVFDDTAPDRWGRLLLERRERQRARVEGRRPRALGTWDFLLGVSDTLRMGALRFVTADGRHLDDTPGSVPPLARLRALEAAARRLEDPAHAGDDEDEALGLLLAPGASLGGARPKASFRAGDDSLWIAKFPSRSDRHDVGACEYLLVQLARAAGVEVPDTRLLRLGGPRHVFAARRFDRLGEGRRLYASGMTLTSRRDHDDSSYLDLALAIAEHGARGHVAPDLAQLFRRVVFNVLTAHRDDHLRNHGFLRSQTGWRLAPAFDLNPVPTLAEHQLAIDDASREPDLALVLRTAPFYRLSAERATAVVREVRDALRGWRKHARALALGDAEIGVLEAALGQVD